VRGHARDREALAGRRAVRKVGSLLPFRVGHDRLPADFVEGDVLRRMARGGRDGDRGEDAVGIGRRPLQHLHAAHGAADDAEKIADAELVEQHRLRAHHVADGDDGKIEPVGFAGFRVHILWPGRAHASADDVLTDDEEAVGVDGKPRADHERPPAGLAGKGMEARSILVERQGMADQHCIRPVGIERAVGLIGDGKGAQADA